MPSIVVDLPIDRETIRSFTWREICCQRTGLIRPTRAVITHMRQVQLLRDWWDAPISCRAVRTPYHNAMEGGAANSQHLLFEALTLDDIESEPDEANRFATDLHFSMRSPMLLSLWDTLRADMPELRRRAHLMAHGKVCELVGNTGGVGLYDWGIHWDARLAPARWDKRTER